MDQSCSSYSNYSSYSSYSSYSYSFTDDQYDYPNPMTTAAQPLHAASSPYPRFAAPVPDSPKREDKKTSPLVRGESPKQKRASPIRSGFELDANSLNFFSAQTAAAVSAAVSAAINHQINQSTLSIPPFPVTTHPPTPPQQTSTDIVPALTPQEAIPTDRVAPDTEVAPGEQATDTYTIHSPNRAKNATSEDFVLISPAQSRYSIRQPTKEHVAPPDSALEKANAALAEMKDKYMALSAEFRDYKLKKDGEIRDFMAHEAELRQEARIYQRDLQKLEKEYASVVAKLAEKEDKIMELKTTVKKLENAVQQRISLDTAPSREQSVQQKHSRQELPQPRYDHTPPSAQSTTAPYKPVDSIGDIFGPAYANTISNQSKRSSINKTPDTAPEPKAAQPSIPGPPASTSSNAPIMSFEEFLKQRARNAAMEELQQREAQAKEAMDAKIESLQKQLGTLLTDMQTEHATTQPDVIPNESGKDAPHNKTTFTLEDIDRSDPNYKLLQTMETDYTAMCQQLMLNRDELANLENRSGKRTHKEMMRMRFLEAQINKLDGEANQLRSRLRALAKAKN